MALKISLRDGEKIIVNGAVLSSVGRSELTVENKTTILRGREIMSEAEATSPARRLYFACMMAYIDGVGIARHQDAILARLAELIGVLEAPTAKAMCASFGKHVAVSDYYRALADCRGLIEYETVAFARLDHDAPAAP